ncbi:MAG: ABC transporter ATP-binding protein [Planctomycetes bacterium]|nr:ABC transporter ATP-binding protein [Planctomycetota bacterium]
MVRLVDVHKAFGSHKVLEGVSLDLYAGQNTVIMGPSGSGKSVMLKHIAGLLTPDRGEVYFDGRRIDTLDEAELVESRKRLGFLFQMGALFDSMNVLNNITFPLIEHTKMSDAERRERCAKVLRMVGLSGVEMKMPVDLSGGMKKRVALARAIVLEPAVVLYDEPTTGLDPIRSDVINELILALRTQLKITGVIVTHDMASANKIADRMVMLYDGKIVEDGDPKAFHASDKEVVQRFIRGRADQADLDSIKSGFGDGALGTEAKAAPNP